jgi:hypothetical protein
MQHTQQRVAATPSRLHMPHRSTSELLLFPLRGLSRQANYTDRATAAVGEVVPTFAPSTVFI